MTMLTVGDLTLRRWNDDDVPALIAAAGDPALHRWTRFRAADDAEARRWLDAQHTGWAGGTRYSFAVLDDHGRLLANVVLKRGNPAEPVAEVGYWTAGYARGQGVAPRAVRGLSSWAFTTFTVLERLHLLHHIDNEASCRVAVKAGYPLEAVVTRDDPDPQQGHLHTLSRPAPAPRDSPRGGLVIDGEGLRP
jgi:RimJ/RimL family protein N-acetyltransferase